MKVDTAVIKETKYISTWVFILSLLLQAIFLIIGKWDYTVILGNVLSGFVAILNFFLMGLTVQKAVEKEEKDAKTLMKFSLIYRNILIFASVVIGILLPVFNIWTVIIPIFFPRIAISFRPFFDKK